MSPSRATHVGRCVGVVSRGMGKESHGRRHASTCAFSGHFDRDFRTRVPYEHVASRISMSVHAAGPRKNADQTNSNYPGYYASHCTLPTHSPIITQMTPPARLTPVAATQHCARCSALLTIKFSTP